MSLSDILYAPLQRFYTFVLKKLIGDYLKDELHHRQLEVEIRNGIVELQHIELDVEVLNDSISGLPFSIVKATVSKIRAEIPWHSLSKKNCKIILTGLDLILEPLVDGPIGEQSLSESFLMEASKAALKEEEMATFIKEHLKGSAESKMELDDPRENPEEFAKSIQGMNVIGNKLKDVLGKTEFEVDTASIFFQYSNSDPRKKSAIVGRLSHARYINSRDNEGKNSTKFTKKAVFRGFRIDLLEDVEDSDEALTIAHCEIDKECIFRLNPPPLVSSSPQNSIRMIIEGHLHAMRMLVGPRQLKQVTTALNEIINSASVLQKREKSRRKKREDLDGGARRSSVKSTGEDSENDLDDLFHNKHCTISKGESSGGPNDSNRSHESPAGRPMRASEYKTVESLLHTYEHKKLNSHAMAESFTSFTSHASESSDQFHDCNAGSMHALKTSHVETETLQDGKHLTVSSSSAPVRSVSWSIDVMVDSVQIILLQNDVSNGDWPSDTSWYLTPIPLPKTGRQPPNPSVGAAMLDCLTELGVNHFVANLDGIQALVEQSPLEAWSKFSIQTFKVLEYIKDTSNLKDAKSESRDAFRCIRFAECISEQKVSLAAVDGCESDEDSQESEETNQNQKLDDVSLERGSANGEGLVELKTQKDFPGISVVMQELQTTEKLLNPDVKILISLEDNTGKTDSPMADIDVQLRPLNLHVEIDGIKRLALLSERLRPRHEDSDSVVESEPDSKWRDPWQEGNSAPRSPSSREDFDLDMEDFRRQQILFNEESFSTRPVRKPRNMKRVQFSISRARATILPSSSHGSDGLLLQFEDFVLANHKTSIQDEIDIEEFGEVKWHWCASSIHCKLLATSQDTKSDSSSSQIPVFLNLSSPGVFLMKKMGETQENSIFHPFLAPGTKIGAQETEAFFQRLWDPYRVWETEPKDQEAQDKSSTERKRRSKPAKTLLEFERSCEGHANAALHIYSPKCSVLLTRRDYLRLMKLVKTLTSLFDTAKRDGIGRKEMKGKASLAYEKRSDPSLVPQHPDHVPNPRVPNIEVKVSRKRLLNANQHGLAVSTHLKVLNVDIIEDAEEEEVKHSRSSPQGNRGFQLVVKDSRAFVLTRFNHEDTLYFSVSFRHINLLSSTYDAKARVEKVFPILSNTLAAAVPQGSLQKEHGKHVVQVVHVISNSQGRRHLRTAVNFNSVAIEAPSVGKLQGWLKRLSKYFTIPINGTPSSARHERPASYMYIHATDCAIDYNPPSIPQRGVFLMTRISMRFCDFGPPRALHYTIDLSDLRGYVLSVSKKLEWETPLYEGERECSPGNGTHLHRIQMDSLTDYLDSAKFIRVASVDNFQLAIQLLPKAEADRRQILHKDPLTPDSTIELNRGVLGIQACSDSAYALTCICEQIAKELTPVERQQAVEISFSEKAGKHDSLMKAIDFDAFKPEAAIEHPLSLGRRIVTDGKDLHDGSLGNTTFSDYFQDNSGRTRGRHNEGRESQKEWQARWFEPPSLTDNHFTFKSETDLIYKAKLLNPPRSHPRPQFTFKMHSVRARVQIYGGTDFEFKSSHNQPKEQLQTGTEVKHGNTLPDGDFKRAGLPLSSRLDSAERLPGGQLQTVSIQERDADAGLAAFVQDTYVKKSGDEEPLRNMKGQNHNTDSKESNRRKSTHRKASQNVNLELKGIHMVFNGYGPSSRVASFLALTIDDVDILDEVYASEFQGTPLLCYDLPRKHLRESGSSMVRVKLSSVRPDPQRSRDRQEARMTVNLLPIRLRLDQDTIEFLVGFFVDMSGKSVPKEEAKKSLSHSDSSSHLPNEEEEPPQLYIQSFRIGEFNICLDYKPKRIDLDALRGGEYAQLAHLLRLEEVRITLGTRLLRAIEGWGGLAARLGKDWADQILAQQIHRCLAGVQPLRSIIRVGSGVVDLVVLPLEQFRKDGRVIRGLHSGVRAFVNSITAETFNVATSVSLGAQTLLNSVDGVWNKNSNSISESSRATNVEENPRGLRNGLMQAYQAFSGGLRDAAGKYMVIPADKVDQGEVKENKASFIDAVDHKR